RMTYRHLRERRGARITGRSSSVAARLRRLLPRLLRASLEVIVRGREPREHFGARLEQRFGAWVVHLLHVLARMTNGLFEHGLQLLRVMPGIAFRVLGVVGHVSLLGGRRLMDVRRYR